MNSVVELQQVIDSFKSNIQADNVDIFQKHLLTIKDQFQDNTAVVSLIKMLQSIGKYCASQKNNAHKDAVMILDLITTQLTQLIQAPEIEKEQADEILFHCVHHFNKLKKTITSGPRVSDKEIQDLKSVIFAIDWEISDGTLKALNEVITRLMAKFKHHKLHHTFLKLINNVGRYLAVKKADAHTDSIPFLHSVFEHFEKIVETPEMSLNEKKALLKRDIARFQTFSKYPGSPEKASSMPEDGPGDDVVQPALSHITSPSIQTSEAIPALNVLSENDTSLTKKSQDTGGITPALAGKKASSSEPRDVMDDLFTVKKTSADDLLDAIHLGDGGEHRMPGQPDTIAEADGVKNITPQRMDTEPIPEIGNRLDQFFNLDSSENAGGVSISEDEQGLDRSDSDEGIIPYENEISEEVSKDKDVDVDVPQGVLLDLKNILKDPINCLEQETVQKVNENISHLETLWKTDPDKIFLLETISCLVEFINKSSGSELTDSDFTDSELVDADLVESELTDSDELPLETSPPDVPTPVDDLPKGFWKRIKSVFFN